MALRRPQLAIRPWLLATLVLPMALISQADNPFAESENGPHRDSGLTQEVASQEALAQAAQAKVAAIFSDSGPDIEGQRCLPSRRIRSVDVLDSRTLVFELTRDNHYLVRLKHRCFGLRRDTPISYEIHGSQFCSLDGFRALERWSLDQLVPGPRCSIPTFIPVTETELALVEDRLDADRAAQAEARKAKKAARKAEREAARAQREAA
jgi:hypothetical protein